MATAETSKILFFFFLSSLDELLHHRSVIYHTAAQRKSVSTFWPTEACKSNWQFHLLTFKGKKEKEVIQMDGFIIMVLLNFLKEPLQGEAEKWT